MASHRLHNREGITSERKLMEEALRESEEKLRVMFESTSEGIAVTDLKGKILDVNDAILRMSGLSREELVGQEGFGLMPREDAKKVIEHGTKALESGTGAEKMIQEITPTSGRSYDVGLSMGVLRDSSGDPTGFVAIVRDITESKRAEEALRESEEKHRELVENLNDIIYTVDENGVTTYISPVVESVLGYAPSELIGQSFADSMHEEDLPHATENFLSTLSGNTTMGEYRISTKSGEFRLLHSSNRPIFEGNRVVGATGVLTDITERKRAEEAQRESEEKYRTILEDIEDGYFEVDIDGNFTFFNDPMCEINGYSRDEMMGMNNRQYMDKKNAKKVYQAFNRVYTTGKPSKEFGWEITRKDGTKRFIEASFSLKRNSEDEPIGFRGIVRDITERKGARRSCDTEYAKASSSLLTACSCTVRSITRCSSPSFSLRISSSACLRSVMSRILRTIPPTAGSSIRLLPTTSKVRHEPFLCR